MDTSKILIVDDEPFNVDYIEQELEESGYEILSATNGQEALEIIHTEAPDLVLLDIMMPVMDGFEVLSRLKENADTRDIPVIVISASTDLKSVVKGVKLGAEDYLPKPFEPALLNARISSSLEKKHLRDLQKMYLQSLERELEIGHEIQMGFLPREIPTIEGWEIAAHFKAAHEVAGDYYDVFILPNGDPLLVIGDVAGKGVGAALYMSLFRSLIRATSKTDLLFNKIGMSALSNKERLQAIITYVNQYVFETHGHTSIFSTIFICALDHMGKKLSYINCGNEPAIMVGNESSMTLLWPTGPIVGVLSDAEFVPQEIEMNPSDLLLIHTDGVTDAMNSSDVVFGRERLVTFLESGRRKFNTNSDLLAGLQDQLEDHIGEAAQFDDITILAVKKL
jgi:serine phosphatase RsbU (regulator of sigma subunit)